eukprot:COSAG02_NODE_10186_length_1999_cov_0.885789_1_plen_53_part_00
MSVQTSMDAYVVSAGNPDNAADVAESEPEPVTEFEPEPEGDDMSGQTATASV